MIDKENLRIGLEEVSDFFFEMYKKETDEYKATKAKEYCDVAEDALSLLKELKNEAEWIYGEDETGVDGWHCSECDFFEPWFYGFTDDIDFIRLYVHCPGCGRKMTSYTGKPTQIGG